MVARDIMEDSAIIVEVVEDSDAELIALAIVGLGTVGSEENVSIKHEQGQKFKCVGYGYAVLNSIYDHVRQISKGLPSGPRPGHAVGVLCDTGGPCDTSTSDIASSPEVFLPLSPNHSDEVVGLISGFQGYGPHAIAAAISIPITGTEGSAS